MKKPKIAMPHEEDFDTMLDIGTALRRAARRKVVEEQQAKLQEQNEDDAA